MAEDSRIEIHAISFEDVRVAEFAVSHGQTMGEDGDAQWVTCVELTTVSGQHRLYILAPKQIVGLITELGQHMLVTWAHTENPGFSCCEAERELDFPEPGPGT